MILEGETRVPTEEGGRARGSLWCVCLEHGRQLRVATRATDPGCPKLIVSDYCMQFDIFTGRLHAYVLMILESVCVCCQASSAEGSSASRREVDSCGITA